MGKKHFFKLNNSYLNLFLIIFHFNSIKDKKQWQQKKENSVWQCDRYALTYTFTKVGNTSPICSYWCLYYLSHIVLKHSREKERDGEEATDRLLLPPTLTGGQKALPDVLLCLGSSHCVGLVRPSLRAHFNF